MASITFISRELGLSKATVSRAFDPRFKELVKPETRERIFDFCRKYNYHPSMTARSLSVGKTFKIGILGGTTTTKIFTLFSTTFSNGITTTAIEYGYSPLHIKQDAKANIEQVKSSIADAYIISSFFKGDAALEIIKQRQIPALIYDPYNQPGHKLPVYYRDIRPAYRQLWQNLDPAYHDQTAFIWRGYVPGKWQDLQDSSPEGVKIANIQISNNKENFLFHRESARAGAEKMLDQLLKYKMLWCSSDLVALGICDTLKAHGIIPGKDIYIVGFDNLEATVEDFPEQTLTTIDPLWKHGGETLVRMLLDSLASGTALPERTSWIPEVIYRNTFVENKTN